MAVEIKPKITDEDLLALGDVRAEVIDGEIVIDMAPNRMDHSIYVQRLGNYIDTFAGLRHLGRTGGDMTAFKLEEDPKGGIKGALVPDIYYLSYARFPSDADIAIVPDFAPDLAIEMISESETHLQVISKTNKYLDHGTALVWHVIPSLRQVRVFTAKNRAGHILNDADTLTGGDLLPGFAIPVRAIFDIDDAGLQGETLRALLP